MVNNTKPSLADRKHPYHEKYYDMWAECYAAYKGGEEFIDKVLQRHQLEFEEDFEIRRERAFYLNFVKRIVNAMTDLIYDNIIVRPSATEYTVLYHFYKKASYFGESYETFIRRMSKLSSVFGWVVVAVEFISNGKKQPTIADVEAGKSYPKLKLFTPLEFVDWVRDGENFSYGLVERDIYVRADQNNPLSEIIDVTEHILYTDKEIVVLHDDIVVGEFKHNLGKAPLVLVNDGVVDEFGFSEPLIKDISKIAATLVNWLSVVDEVFERQALSQLVCPDDGSFKEEAARLLDRGDFGAVTSVDDLQDYEKIVLKRIGTSKIFTYPANSGHPPQYISPPASDMRIGWDIIMSLAQTMFFLVGLGGVREDSYTASSKARESTLNLMKSYLKDKASNLQSAEENILSIYFSYMPKVNQPERLEVRYPAEIEVGSYLDFFNQIVKNLIKPNISSEFNKAMLKRLIDRCPYLTFEEKEKVKNNIEKGEGIFEIPK